MTAERTLDDVARQLQANKKKQRSCALLIGAGCSVQAGIPLARGFVEAIKQRFPHEYERAATKAYPFCMGELSAADRHDLISEFIDQAKVNWAHISIGLLMQGGFIDRVLTTNFDPMVMRACALLNLFPAVYDMAVVRQGFLADYVRDLAVFHLHGQRDGFVQLHRETEVEALSRAIKPLFDDTTHDRSWLVIGYSGANDPVFRVLADRPGFPNRLFWVGFRDEQPSPDVKTELLDADKDAYWISGHDPDNFLVQLADKLGCYPPGFLAKPFSHLLEIYATLAGYRMPGQEVERDWTGRARSWIHEAISKFEATASAAPPPPMPGAAGGGATRGATRGAAPHAPASGLESALESADSASMSAPVGDIVGEAWAALIAGDYDTVIALGGADRLGKQADLAEPTAGAHFGRGKALSDEAQKRTGDQADGLFQEAIGHFAKALAIRPQDDASLSNLGNTLFRWGRTKEGEAADELIAEAENKLRQAEAIRPGVGAYRLARVAAYRHRDEDCRHWLELARRQGMLPTRAYMESDPELAPVHGAAWFQSFVEALGPA
jgi:NAD-dependent protein deacetylases, SIR2 family